VNPSQGLGPQDFTDLAIVRHGGPFAIGGTRSPESILRVVAK
jgi:hypothetical protein